MRISPKIITLFLLLTISALSGQAVLPIQNGKLTGDLNGNGQDINNAGSISLGSGSGSARVHILPGSNPTTQADGIAIGSDIHIYRSASGTLTLGGNVIVTGTISGNGNVITLGGVNNWSGTNSFSGTTAFSGAVTFGSGGFAFSGSGAGDLRAALSLVPGTHVQAYSANLLAMAGLSPSNGAMIMGNGTTWTSKSGGTLLTALGLGTGDSPSFSGLTLSGGITAASAIITSLSTPGATSSGAAMLIGGAGIYSDSGVLTVPGGFKTLGNVQLSNDTGLPIYALGIVYFKANQDTNLYRLSAGVLKTDGDFVATNLKPSNPLSSTYGGLGLDTHAVAAGAYPYTSGTGIWTTGTITSFGRSLVASADGAGARSVLGYGSVALLNTVTAAYGGIGLDTSSTPAGYFPYTSATGTWATASVTTFARSLLDDADASAMRATLGLGSVSTVSMVTPALGGLGIDTSATAANSFPYTNGSGTWTTGSATIFGRSVLAAADAAAGRTALGLGSLATLSMATPAFGGLGINTSATAADSFLYTSATGTWTTGTATTFGRSVLSAADAAAGRTALGLGSLATLNLVTPALGGTGIDTSATVVDKFLYTSGTGTWTVGTATTFGRSLLAATDATAAKSILELAITNYIATLTGGPGITVSGGTGVGATPTVSLSGALPMNTITANAAITYTWAADVPPGTTVLLINCTDPGATLELPASPIAGQYLILKNIGDSNCTISGGAIPINDGATLSFSLAGSVTSSAREVVTLIYDANSNCWQVINRGTYAP